MNDDQPNTVDETPADPWVDMLIGRQWEIYWEHNSDYEDDWYDAHVEAFIHPTPGNTFLFRISFVGDDQMYEMTLTPSKVRARDGIPDQSPATLEWAQALEGKDVEIYWDKEGEAGKLAVPVEELDEPGWYLANVISFDRNAQHSGLFKVEFEGEDSIYEMPLKPEHIRPSALAWVKRTLALLQMETSSFHEWVQTLPLDTRTLDDTLKIAELEEVKDAESIVEESDWIRQWLHLIRTQLYLRTRLAPIETEKGRRTHKGIPAPTEIYVEYLVQCLKKHEDCASWYQECEKLIDDASQAAIESNWSSESVFDIVVKRGCDYLESLLAVDPSVVGSKRKCISSTPNARRVKRRRKTIKDFWTSEGQLQEEFDVQDLKSMSSFQRFVAQTAEIDQRWHFTVLVKMLKTAYASLIAPFQEWKWRVEYALGQRDDPFDDEITENKIGDSTDQETEGESADGNETVFLSYDDLNALIDQAKTDGLLSKFEMDVDQLSSQMGLILEFEKRGLMLVSSVFEDSVTLLNKEQDSIVLQLRQLQKACSTPELVHIHPLGSSGSSLSRLLIRNALLCREWFLDLRCAETQRERVAFIENVVSRWSYLPPIDSKEITIQSDEIVSRLKRLSARCTDHLILFDKISSSLSDRDQEARRNGFLSEKAVENALAEFKCVAVLSLAEEKLATRLDLLRWEQRAKVVLNLDRPSFADVESLHRALEALLGGNSVSRVALIKTLRQNSFVDTEIRSFVKCDDEEITGPLSSHLRSRYSISSTWKERAESLLSTLRAFGNESMADCHVQQKPAAMIDIRRIADLLKEYENLQVDIAPLNELLRRVYDDATKWSISITATLTSPNRPLKACLNAALEFGLNRPKGIILDPTRQVCELVIDLLQWYIAVETLVQSEIAADDDVAFLLLKGIEVVSHYADKRLQQPMFTVFPMSADFILKHISSSRVARPLMLNNLGNSDLARHFLMRIIDEGQNGQGSHPFQSLIFWLWLLHVKVFIKEATGIIKAGTDLTLTKAKKLLAEQPMPFSHLGEPSFVHHAVDVVKQLKEMVVSAETFVKTTEEILTTSKNLIRVASSNEAAVRNHHRVLKDIFTSLKNRSVERDGIAFDRSLECQVEQDLKIVTWLIRTFSYPILHSHDPSLWQGEHVKNDPRVPWDVLVSLLSQSPSFGQDQGDLACIKLRLKELHDEAALWQDDISRLTMLSLRGGKRRNPGCLEEAKESSSIIDMNKVEELCSHPILNKVSFAREAGIKHMLRRSKDFERALFDFLGNDYDGLNVDKAALPEAGSLVASDGSFLPLRLTGSPVYQAMISALASISQIAEDVFANTPGKAAFDWICSALSWIESLNKALVIVPRDTDGGTTRNITIAKDGALQLLRDGDDVFADVPEDLRRTLSEHKIYISSSKEGKLTIKSRKGGAHHALGVVAVRWCPLLYESLKCDVSKLNKWEETLKSVESTYESFLPAWCDGSDSSQESIGTIFGMHEALTDLSYTLKELVVLPAAKEMESAKGLLHSIETKVMPSMNVSAATAYLNRRYVDGPFVVEMRFDRLDALAFRQHFNDAENSIAVSVLGPSEGFGRATARRLLLAALRKGLSGLGISDSEEESLFLCSSKAWDIENAVCDEFLDNSCGDAIGNPYKEKIRAIKRSLEDTQNKMLHAKVLLGEITPEVLVTMSVEALANPMAQKQRADAEARQNNVLVAPMVASRKVDPDSRESVAQRHGAEGKTIPSASLTTQHSSVPSETTSKTILLSKLSALRDTARASQAVRRPSPPPPISFVASTAETSVGYGVTNTEGGDLFRLNVGGGYHMMAQFYAEGRPGPYISNFLPEQLVEKRRSPWKVLDQFLREKVRSGKYQIAALRMHPCSDKDVQTLRSFAQDYEERDRVATFQIRDDKVYLITPKFQSQLRDVVPFETSRPATYAILLRSV